MGVKSVIGWFFRPGFSKKYSNPVEGLFFLNKFISGIKDPSKVENTETVGSFKEARVKHRLSNKRLAVMEANMARTGFIFLVLAGYLLFSLIVSSSDAGSFFNYFEAFVPQVNGFYHTSMVVGFVLMGVSAIKYFYFAHLVKNRKLGSDGKSEFLRWLASPEKWLTSPFIKKVKRTKDQV